MQVRMRIHRTWQDKGQEWPLSVGHVYELPDLIGAALVATGAAERIDAPSITEELAAATRDALAPEVVAHGGAPERKRR